MEKPNLKQQNISERPRKSPLAAKYPRLIEIYGRLEGQNTAIYRREQQLSELEQEYANTKGIFRGTQRKELQRQIRNNENSRQHAGYSIDGGAR